jgi:hypothetical protein
MLKWIVFNQLVAGALADPEGVVASGGKILPK